MMVSFVLSFFPRDVLDEILNLIGSVSEGFPSYSLITLDQSRHLFLTSIISLPTTEALLTASVTLFHAAAFHSFVTVSENLLKIIFLFFFHIFNKNHHRLKLKRGHLVVAMFFVFGALKSLCHHDVLMTKASLQTVVKVSLLLL